MPPVSLGAMAAPGLIRWFFASRSLYFQSSIWLAFREDRFLPLYRHPVFLGADDLTEPVGLADVYHVLTEVFSAQGRHMGSRKNGCGATGCAGDRRSTRARACRTARCAGRTRCLPRPPSRRPAPAWPSPLGGIGGVTAGMLGGQAQVAVAAGEGKQAGVIYSDAVISVVQSELIQRPLGPDSVHHLCR